MNQRVRERIPTPENDNRLNLPHNNPFSNIQSIASGVALTAQSLATNPSIFPSANSSVPILGTLLLSPINETDSVNNTLTSGHAPNKPILPLNFKSQFGSLMIPSNAHQDMEPTNSFVVLPSSMNENETIPVSISSAQLSSNQGTSSTAVITELPLDQPDTSANVHTSDLHPIMQRQHSFDSNSGESTSVSSTLSKRPAGTKGKKHNEVYV